MNTPPTEDRKRSADSPAQGAPAQLQGSPGHAAASNKKQKTTTGCLSQMSEIHDDVCRLFQERETELEQTKEKLKEKTAEVESKEQEVERMKDSKETTERELSEAKKELAKMTEQWEAYKSGYNKKRKELDKVRNQLKEMRTDLDGAMKELREMDEELGKKDEELNEVRGELDKAEEDLDEAEEELEQEKQKHQETHTKMIHWRTEAHKATKKNEVLEDKIEALKEQVESIVAGGLEGMKKRMLEVLDSPALATPTSAEAGARIPVERQQDQEPAGAAAFAAGPPSSPRNVGNVCNDSQCPFCGKTYTRRYSLTCHWRTWNPNYRNDKPENSTCVKSKFAFLTHEGSEVFCCTWYNGEKVQVELSNTWKEALVEALMTFTPDLLDGEGVACDELLEHYKTVPKMKDFVEENLQEILVERKTKEADRQANQRKKEEKLAKGRATQNNN